MCYVVHTSLNGFCVRFGDLIADEKGNVVTAPTTKTKWLYSTRQLAEAAAASFNSAMKLSCLIA